MGRKRIRDTHLSLPPRVYRHGSGFRYVPKSAPQIHLGKNYQEAMKEYRRLKAAGLLFHPSPDTVREFVPAVHYCSDWHKQLVRQARANARAKGVRVTITVDDVRALAARAGGMCEISGIPFSWDRPPGAKRRPWVPSLDRIERTGPYSLGNLRLVCCMVNIAMGEWGEDALKRMARGVRKRSTRHPGSMMSVTTTEERQ